MSIKKRVPAWKKRYLVQKLNECCKSLDELYHINSGACCYVSHILAQLFEKYDISYKLIVYSHYDDLPKDFYGLTWSCYHYCLKVNGVLVNRGDIPRGYNKSEYDNVTSQDLYKHYKIGDWNQYYNTHNNDKVKQVISIVYDLFEKEIL